MTVVYEMIVNVDKRELLEKVRGNRTRHQEVFLAALEGYRQEALRVLRAHIEDIESGGRVPTVDFHLPRPEDHTRDYDRVIGMLEMDQGTVFRLDQQTYRNYVDDDWAWKRQWSRLSSSYAAQSYTSNYGDVAEDD